MAVKKNFFKPTNDLSYKTLSNLYHDIATNVYQKNADFVLPQNPRFTAFGNKIAFCQIINSWFAKNPLSKVRIYDNTFPNNDDEGEKAISKFVADAELPTLLALCHGLKSKILGYSHKTKDYTDKFNESLPKRLVFDYLELTRISNEKQFYKEYYQIHPDFFEQNFFINNLTFYTKYGSQFLIKNQIAIDEVTKKLFTRIDALGSELTIKWLKELQTYFYEVFDNTFKWGRSNWLFKYDEEILEKSNRIFFISSKVYTNIDMSSNVNNLDLKLHAFSKQQKVVTNQRGANIRLLELSILDNGLGIVQTYKRVNIKKELIEVEDEYKFLIEAFKFGTTSDNTSKAAQRGIGLNKVIQKTRDIFLIVRTGHLHLYRNFALFPYQDNEDFYLFDVSETNPEKIENAGKIKSHPWADGTLFTFMVPL